MALPCFVTRSDFAGSSFAFLRESQGCCKGPRPGAPFLKSKEDSIFSTELCHFAPPPTLGGRCKMAKLASKDDFVSKIGFNVRLCLVHSCSA